MVAGRLDERTAVSSFESSRRLSSPVVRVAMAWLLPGLLAAMVIGNQDWGNRGGIGVGQFLSWLNDAAAATVLLAAFSRRVWPVLLIAAVFTAKFAQLSLPGTALPELAYDLALNAIFAAAGGVVARNRPTLVLGQLAAVCLLSVPWMALQAAGIGEWTQWLATEHVGGATDKSMAPALFVEEADLIYNVVQGRPSSFLHSNNFLSLVLLFSIALHLSFPHVGRRNLRGGAMAAMSALAMAKVVFLGVIAFAVAVETTGTRTQRRASRMLLVWLTVSMITYALFLPGLFALQTSGFKLAYSITVRVNELTERLGYGTALGDWIAETIGGESIDSLVDPLADPDLVLSGVTQMLQWLPLALAIGLAVVPVWLRRLGALRRVDASRATAALLCGMAVIIYLTAVPFLRAQFLWFIAGFALLPVTLVRPGLRAGLPAEARAPMETPA